MGFRILNFTFLGVGKSGNLFFMGYWSSAGFFWFVFCGVGWGGRGSLSKLTVFFFFFVFFFGQSIY